ncbi:helix-turn-helix domain-containing protein [Plantactinospora sp. KLBMP9567]|uniref:helix-turn-helix domain-containing protein n=1 Tax=Plantactinospora sp. KLBMP9567 TaxID=3085900 RepID=UPI0029821985|nr:helix-turn-helix domain-containing protein [Plantactinospora sp. KLBMP9567]MDW5328384.1 serine hydrolase [Plantactinospora sp. KLBMP9567]
MHEELAGWLRQLRDLTGRSLRELARDVHVSSSSLSRYFSGQAVPPWPTVVALCKAAGRDPRPLREVWERAKDGPRTSTAAPDPQTGEFTVWDEAEGGRWSKPPAFQGGGGGLVSTADDYHAYFRMLLNGGMYGSERILSRPAVELMTTNRLTPDQQAARDAMARNNVHVSFGQGQHGGWGFGMAVRAYRGDYASIGQFGWDGGSGTSTYADPENQLTGILLTQVGMSVPNPARLIHDFWTTVYQAIDG